MVGCGEIVEGFLNPSGFMIGQASFLAAAGGHSPAAKLQVRVQLSRVVAYLASLDFD